MKEALTKAGSAAGDASARRKRQGRRRQDAGHDVRQCRAAGLFRRRRHQGRAADVQGAQQAVRAGVLVARPGRQPAQYRRQPQHDHARASTARPRWPASRTPTTIWRNFARRWTNWGLPPPPTSSSRPTTASRRSPRKARPARRRRRPMRTPRKVSCRWASSPIDLAKALEPAAVRSQRQERAGRRQRPSQSRQRRARHGSDQARSGGRHQWRLRPDLSAEQGQASSRGRAIKALLEQDYVSGLFVDDELGRFPGHAADVAARPQGQGGDAASVDRGQFPLLGRRAATSRPTARSQVADTVLRQGQGMHGSFSRGDTMNFMAAIGPDFKAGYRRSAAGQQCRCRHHRGAAARA